MGLLDRLENGLEKAVRGAFAKGSKAQVEPVEIASRLRREMDNHVLVVSTSRSIAPNNFEVLLAPEDFTRAESWGTALAEELCDVAINHARSQGYILPGPVRVAFIRHDAGQRGRFEITSRADKSGSHPSSPSVSPAPAAAASVPVAAPAQAPVATAPAPARQKLEPVLDIAGQRYLLNASSVILGRSSDADIPVEDTGVSRRHLEIRSQNGQTWAVDLGSTNGSYVNGQKLDGSIELTDGSVITMGRVRITFRLVPAQNGGGA